MCIRDREKREAAAKRHPLQKIGNPEEIAKMVVFLLSDSSSWITGQIFGIDGGMSTIKPVSYTHLDVYKRQVIY